MVNKKEIPLQPATIVIYANWANLEGYSKPYESRWFDDIKKTSPTYNNLLDIDIRRIPLHLFPKDSFYGKIYIDDTKHTTLSVLSSKYVILHDSREYNSPYIKRHYFTNQQIPENFADVVCERVDMLQGPLFSKHGCKICFDLTLLGGKNTKLYENRNNGTSFSWRDTLFATAMCCFYNPNTMSQKIAEHWIDENDTIFIGEDGCFSKKDRRIMAFSYSKKDEDNKLDKLWDKYYDSKTKYEKLLDIKKIYDRKKIFSANNFCIDGKNKLLFYAILK